MATRANKGRYYPGDHKVECDTCGLVYLRSECKKQWDGYLVCAECFDPKNPQLELKGRREKIGVKDVRVEKTTFKYDTGPDDL